MAPMMARGLGGQVSDLPVHIRYTSRGERWSRSSEPAVLVDGRMAGGSCFP